MTQPGFIHDKLDMKLLILYIMARVMAPIDLPTLTDLALCDGGADYFLFAESVSELVASGHLEQQGKLYHITEKGRSHSEVTESSLPYSLRLKCSKSLARLNGQLRRAAQIRATATPREDGAFDLELAMDDNDGNLFTLRLLVGGEEQANHLASRFRAAPEHIYNNILTVLFTAQPDKEAP